MATYTTNYNLIKPDATDYVDVDNLNDNADIIDSQMKTNADNIATLNTGKQDVLIFDSTPTSGSANPVTSGGIYTALTGKADTATTLSGYGITDAYTATQVDSAIATQLSSTLKPGGSITFANLPALSASVLGYVYNIEDEFTTTSDFVEGAGLTYPAGTDVAIIVLQDGTTLKYDVYGDYEFPIDTTPTSGSNNAVSSGGVYTALSGKQATITGAATTITSSDLTASRALISNSSGKVTVSAVTSTELGYLDGVTSNVQTQLNAKQATLTFDTTPKSGSANPVTSGGIYTALTSIINTIYPVGAIYMSTSSTNPATLFGVGTWTQITDTFLVSAGSTYTAGSTGGSATHTHSAGSLYAQIGMNTSSEIYARVEEVTSYTSNRNASTTNTTTGSTRNLGTYVLGTTATASSLPPYLAVYTWKRTA